MKSVLPPPAPTPAIGEGARPLPPLVVCAYRKSPKTSRFLPKSSLVPLATNSLRLVLRIIGLPKSVVFSAVAPLTAIPAGVWVLTTRYTPAAWSWARVLGVSDGLLLMPGDVIAALKPEAPIAIRVEPARTLLPTRPG